jgi:hypothetical protein
LSCTKSPITSSTRAVSKTVSMVFFGEVAYGFWIREMLVFHEKSDSVSAFARTKILPDLFGRRYHERGRTLVGKRAESLKIAAGAFELYKITYYLLNAGGFKDGIDGVF